MWVITAHQNMNIMFLLPTLPVGLYAIGASLIILGIIIFFSNKAVNANSQMFEKHIKEYFGENAIHTLQASAEVLAGAALSYEITNVKPDIDYPAVHEELSSNPKFLYPNWKLVHMQQNENKTVLIKLVQD